MSRTPDEHHQRVTDVFLAVADLAPDQRAAELHRLCDGDKVLEDEVMKILEFEAGTPKFLEDTAIASLGGEVLSPSDRTSPKRFGHFRILGVLGEGGMGRVFEAQQDRPRRSVALKVLNAVFATDQMLRRFEFESELLAQLQHPGIAQVYEAGIEDTGHGPQPWFAMEIVRGVPITEHAARLDVPGRLRCMIQVCEAIDHAHRKGIVHRDLKPGNILVNDAGNPKILDFGVARASTANARSGSMLTAAGHLIGTLQYMSPEQTMQGDVDARSDVYALGLILYELLSGRRPYEVSERPIPEAVRIIQEAEPVRLGVLQPSLRGDLETIVDKALAKDRARRYGSSSDLAADLRRFLVHEPIEARPASRIYLLQKFVRRHRGLSIGMAALAVGLISTSWQAYQKSMAQDVAEHKRKQAELALDREQEAAATLRAIHRLLLLDLLQSPDPRRQGRDIKVVEVLDTADAKASLEFVARPRIEASVRATLGKSYLALGEVDRAENNTRRAVELFRQHADPEDPDALAAQSTLVEICVARNDVVEGLPLAQELRELQRRTLGEEHLDTLVTMTNLATLLIRSGDLAAGQELLRRTIEVRKRVLGPEHAHTLLAEANLAAFLSEQGLRPEAQALQQHVHDVRSRKFGPDHPDTLLIGVALAFNRFVRGEPADHEAVFRDLVERMTRVYGERHHVATNAMVGLGHVLQSKGRAREATECFEKLLAIREEALGQEHPETHDARLKLVPCLALAGRIDEAIALAEMDLDLQRQLSAEDGPALADSLTVLGEVLVRAGEIDRAEAMLQQALEIFRGTFGNRQDLRTQRVQDGLATIKLRRARSRS